MHMTICEAMNFKDNCKGKKDIVFYQLASYLVKHHGTFYLNQCSNYSSTTTTTQYSKMMTIPTTSKSIASVSIKIKLQLLIKVCHLKVCLLIKVWVAFNQVANHGTKGQGNPAVSECTLVSYQNSDEETYLVQSSTSIGYALKISVQLYS